MTFFYIFLKNPLLLYPYLVKNVNSVKTKSIGCSFFPIFHDNVTAFMPMLCQKNFPSLKNTLLMPIFVQRNVHSLKNIMIKKKYREKPPTVMPIFRQKHQLCRNYIKLWVKKVDRMPFSKKNVNFSKLYYIMARRSQQDTLFSRFFTKKSLLSCTYFVKKTFIL